MKLVNIVQGARKVFSALTSLPVEPAALVLEQGRLGVAFYDPLLETGFGFLGHQVNLMPPSIFAQPFKGDSVQKCRFEVSAATLDAHQDERTPAAYSVKVTDFFVRETLSLQHDLGGKINYVREFDRHEPSLMRASLFIDGQPVDLRRLAKTPHRHPWHVPKGEDDKFYVSPSAVRAYTKQLIKAQIAPAQPAPFAVKYN